MTTDGDGCQGHVCVSLAQTRDDRALSLGATGGVLKNGSAAVLQKGSGLGRGTSAPGGQGS